MATPQDRLITVGYNILYVAVCPGSRGVVLYYMPNSLWTAQLDRNIGLVPVIDYNI